MACMEHVCMKCGHIEFNNNNMLACPKCKAYEIRSFWDEEPDQDRDEE